MDQKCAKGNKKGQMPMRFQSFINLPFKPNAKRDWPTKWPPHLRAARGWPNAKSDIPLNGEVILDQPKAWKEQSHKKDGDLR